ncbi:Rid family hydrolase [Entomobacter blattae]|uniref:Endoribonuclease L-PSP n=1 Tax=Entomobacter blattae TaxID=2762277 RepID=A0A7H1NUU5_9PROT|nr:Rid family hydrolase [Entomobacter blattae]QNT79555.1 Endoribonuclease L-PSP [Entomobacter blattae]
MKKIIRHGMRSILLAAFCIQTALAAEPSSITRNVDTNQQYPFAVSVEVPADSGFVYLSSITPDIINKDVNSATQEAYGNTEAQARNVFEKLQDILGKMNLSMADVIQIRAYLAADPKQSDTVDYNGFMAAYHQFFATKGQPNIPTGSVVEIKKMFNPAWLVTVEAVAVRRASKSPSSP